MASRKWYVVWAGNETGVFDSWEECKIAVNGFPGARYKGFATREEAIAAYRGNPEEYTRIFRAMAQQPARVLNYENIPGIVLDSIAVDAACSHNPGPVEYQGVDIQTGARLFHVGPLQQGTNNIGEFLAIVHGLAWLYNAGNTHTAIYSDSRTALAWVRGGKARTQIAPSAENAHVRQLIARAEAWLATHTYRTPVLKWDTEQWGEIPADFGRK